MKSVHFTSGRRGAAVAAALGSVLVATVLVASPSTAEVPKAADGTVKNHIATSTNSSDPYAFRCANPYEPREQGYCIVTSEDMGRKPIDPGGPAENYYPMYRTKAWYSADGLKFTKFGEALQEHDIKKNGTLHMWAPSVRWRDYPVSRNAPDDEYYLYTPNLRNKNDKYSSRIYVTYSKQSTTGYGDEPLPGTNQTYAEVTVDGQPNQAFYMSDPEVFVDGPSQSVTHGNNDYLIWANGDNGNCGDLSIGRMTSPTTVAKIENNDLEKARIKVHGVSVLGDCTGTTDNKHPYIEGGSMFRSDNWETDHAGGMPGPYILMFSAKPTVVPQECKVPGQTQNTNQVIAYATAPSVTGPFQYQGVIQCGSESEWTDQGTIQEVTLTNGDPRLMLIYHDGPDPDENGDKRERTMHSECLYINDGKFVTTTRTVDGAVNLDGDRQWCLSSRDIVAIKSKANGKYLQARPGGGVTAGSAVIGEWEEFGLVSLTSGKASFTARNAEKILLRADGRTVDTFGKHGVIDTKWDVTILGTGPGWVDVRVSEAEGTWHWFVQDDGDLGLAPRPRGNGYSAASEFRIEYLNDH